MPRRARTVRHTPPTSRTAARSGWSPLISPWCSRWSPASFLAVVAEPVVRRSLRWAVAIYHGVEVDTPVIHLHRVVERTDLMIDGLPEFEHDQVSGGIPAEDRAAAEQTVQRLREPPRCALTAP